MRLYHVTPHADAIMQEGFRDGEGSYGFVGLTLRGVFLSNEPVTPDEAGGDVLSIDLPDDLPFDDYEIVDEGAPPEWRREWHFPAALLNEVGVVRLHERDAFGARLSGDDDARGRE